MARKILNGLDLTSQKIINLADGSNPTDAVTKQQLDAVSRGLDWKNSVRAASTTNLTLSGTQTVDGVALAAGDRVLVKDQSTASANGIYVVASGAWTRATDFDDSVEVTSGAAVTVESGTVNGDKMFVLATDGAITVGTTALSFTTVGGTGTAYTAGNGLTLSGSQFSVTPKASGGIVVDSQGVAIDSTQLATLGIARKVSGAIPAGSTSAAITHGLNTLDVKTEIIEVSTGAAVEADVVSTSTSVVTVTFATAPTTNQYRYVIFG